MNTCRNAHAFWSWTTFVNRPPGRRPDFLGRHSENKNALLGATFLAFGAISGSAFAQDVPVTSDIKGFSEEQVFYHA